ncbi:MAG: SpoIIE family protein phosphatase [Chlamydiota bacterium]
MNKIIVEKRNLVRSLAGRVFIVSVLLLIFPLFLHTLLLYRHEYKESIKDLSISLHILSDNSSLFVEESLEFRKHLLDDTWRRIVEEKISLDKRIAFVEKQKENIEVGKFLYLTDPKEFPEIFENKEGIFIGKLSGEEGFIYISRMLPDEGALLIAIPASEYLKKLALVEKHSFPIEISFITDVKTVFASTLFSKEFNQKPLVLAPQKDIDNFYSFTKDKSSYFGSIAKIDNTNFSLLISLSKDSVIQDLKKDFYRRILSAIFFLIFIGGGLALWIIYLLSKPLESLYWTMQKVLKGDLYARFHKKTFGFEINILGDIFNRMIDNLISQQREAEKEKMLKLAYWQELRIGHEIQKSMFPLELPNFPCFEMSTGYLPAKEVGGDFYDLFLPEKGKLLVLIADTSGKGVPACLYSLSIRSMFRAYASMSSNLQEMISQVNRLFYLDSEKSGVFVTAWAGIYDEKSGLFHYVSSGHYPPLLKKKDQRMEEMHTPGMALGVDLSMPIQVASFPFEVGDTLLLYTDGVLDATNKEGKFFGKERLKNFFVSTEATTTEGMKEGLMQEISKFSFNETQHDDITLVVIRRLF